MRFSLYFLNSTIRYSAFYFALPFAAYIIGNLTYPYFAESAPGIGQQLKAVPLIETYLQFQEKLGDPDETIRVTILSAFAAGVTFLQVLIVLILGPLAGYELGVKHTNSWVAKVLFFMVLGVAIFWGYLHMEPKIGSGNRHAASLLRTDLKFFLHPLLNWFLCESLLAGAFVAGSCLRKWRG